MNWKRNKALLFKRVCRRQFCRELLDLARGLLLVIFLLAFAGCGYTAKTIFPNNIKTVHVDMFKNNIDITKEVSAKDNYEVYRPNLEMDLRDVIVNRIFLDGNFKVADKDSADAVLEGEILQYRKDPLRYQDEVAQEYRISLICDVKLINQKDSSILFEEENITGDTTYFTTGALQKTETSALNDAMLDLARRVVNKIIENW
ncbi:MAG: LptE family protein [Candidatus Omnitrophota bacterium]|nr:LptE family protein [Candidatus Omnitrophota bacterium]